MPILFSPYIVLNRFFVENPIFFFLTDSHSYKNNRKILLSILFKQNNPINHSFFWSQYLAKGMKTCVPFTIHINPFYSNGVRIEIISHSGLQTRRTLREPFSSIPSYVQPLPSILPQTPMFYSM